MSNRVNLTLDIMKASIKNPLITVRQGDGNFETLRATVTSNGEPLDLQGFTIVFMGTTAGKHKIVDGNVTIVDASKGIFEYTPSKAWGMDIGGFRIAYFKFVSGDGTTSSANLQVEVIEAVDLTQEEAQNYISVADATIAEAKQHLTDSLADIAASVDVTSSAASSMAVSVSNVASNAVFQVNSAASNASSAAESATAKIAQINYSPETFSDLSALKYTYPNGKTGLFVTADTGHKYIWVNNTWTDAGIYQAAGIDYNVDGIRKFTPGKANGSVNPFDGTVTATTSVVYYTVDVTNVDKLTFYSESFSTNLGYAFYDASGTFIPGSGLLEKSVGYQTIDVPIMATTFKVTSRIETQQLVTLYYNTASVEVNSNSTDSLKNMVYGNKKNLKSKYYQRTKKLISSSTGKYVTVGNSTSVLIPVSDLGKAVKIKANATSAPSYTFLKTFTENVGDTPDYATGYNGVVHLSNGQQVVLKVPSNAGYLFVTNTFDNGSINVTYPEVITPLKDTTITLAASNSSDLDKARADFIGTGTNDELMFNDAITALVYGGTIKLLDGDYYIDSFPYHNNSAVYFENNGYARTINFEGSTENKSFLSDYGVSIHVTKTAFDSTVSGKDYNVFVGSETNIPIGDWHGLPNNVNFKNFYLFFDTSQKQMVGINGQYFGSMYIEQVGVYSKSYFDDRFNHRKPVTPVINSIGVISVGGANDEMARIGMDTVNVGGLGTGIIVARAEHLIMKNSTVSRCVIGYNFIGDSDKPLTLINNADEGNTHLPQFKGRGLITSIDFSIERLDAGPIPDDPNGNTNPFASEVTPGAWKGSFDYNIQGSALGIHNFWSPESGNNIKTRNINANKFGTVNPSYPDYLQEFFRTDLNKKVIYNGSGWYDASGNVVP